MNDMQPQIININVNGMDYELEEKPNEMLVDLLRSRLGLTGTKVGCGEAECGACTVLLDGKPVLSCSYPAVKAGGHSVITIEGLADQTPAVLQPAHSLHPLQEAFIAKGAVQCGFCIPGQIMTAYGLLLNNPKPDSESIKAALKDTLCRCAGYSAILEAVQEAGEVLSGDGAITPRELPASKNAGKIVGRVVNRPEAVDKVTGAALFSDDLQFDGMLVGRVKRAEIPHGFVTRIDTRAAEAFPGVVAVLTARDLTAARYHGLVINDWPILVGVGERVRYVGDAVAIVAAETKEIAAEALDLIQVDFEILPVIDDPVKSRLPEAIQLHPNGNLLKHIKVRKGDVEQGFAESDVIIEHTFHTPTTDHAFIEPECSIARLTTDGRMEVFVGSQIPYSDRQQVADALGWPQERVRVTGMLIGGGFGGKEDIMGQIHAALLAERTKRPVKILFDRHESLMVHPKRHATRITVKMGARKDGRLVAVQTELFGDTGAYASLGEKVMTRATTHSIGPYESEYAKADCYAMYTNNPPAGAFRGFGVTQSAFAVESTMDMLAEKLGLDPIAFRKMNALKVGSVTGTGQVLRESVGLLECIQKVEDELRKGAPGNPFEPVPVDGDPTRLRGWGFSVAFKNTGLGGGAVDQSGADVELFEDGTVEVRTSSAELGQGLCTVLQMLVAEEMDLPVGQVKVLLSDTDLTPDGGPTTASRQTYVTGNAGLHAAKAFKQAVQTVLAEKFDCSPDEILFAGGIVNVSGREMTYPQVYQEFQGLNRLPKVTYVYTAPTTQSLGQPGDMHFAFSFAAQAAQIEVDTNTGEVKVIKIIAANDVGTAINPLGLAVQVEGGAVMGLGNALTEVFLTKEGKVITDRMARYRIPSIVQAPDIVSFIVEHPIASGPFGAKGVGEIVSIPTTPAITNAIYNITGYRVDRLPVDQEMIVRHIHATKFDIGA
jgi:CO/xanthine dehydrogenase Mo-binding subunit/aerobic-type carbon monoxide dehydrogenase small subunit (CoxS/CutS family)